MEPNGRNTGSFRDGSSRNRKGILKLQGAIKKHLFNRDRKKQGDIMLKTQNTLHYGDKPGEEIEIDLKDLIFHILYRWRSILIVAIAAVLLMSGWQYYSIEKAHRAGELTQEEKQYELDLESYRASLDKANADIATYTELIRAQKEYRDQSLLYKLNPTEIYQAQRRYYVKVDQSVLDALPQGSPFDPTDYVLSVYGTVINRDYEDQELEEVFGSSNRSYISEIAPVQVSNEGNSISITVNAVSREKAQQGADWLGKQMEALREEAQTVEPHTLTMISKGSSVTQNMSLRDSKNALSKSIDNYQTVLEEAKKKQNELIRKKEPSKPGVHLLRNTVIGGILGFFLMAAWYAALYVLRGRLNSGRDLTSQYGVPVFGELNKSRARHPGKGLDRLIERAEFGKHPDSGETILENAAVLTGEHRGEGALVLTGTVGAETLEKVRAALAKNGEAGEILVSPHVTRESEAIESVHRADAVLWVEEKYVSARGDIRRAAELLSLSEKPVIGAIVV